MSGIHLRGLTWAHTRGFAPLAVLGRVWEDKHPGQRITWEARSLWSFGEEPLEAYLDDFDLFVFDYPFAGEAIEKGWVLPLDGLLPRSVLEERRKGTVSGLHDAFTVDGRQAALAIDVATHVCASRPDLMQQLGTPLPSDWNGIIELARTTGGVAMPMRPTGVWGAFLSLCAGAGDAPFKRADGAAFDQAIAAEALARLQSLARHVDPSCFEVYPVALLNRMAASDGIAYVPLTYGYCTYGIAGYAPHRLAFHDACLGNERRSGAVLGGAGIGISSRTNHPELAAEHLAWLTSPEIQRTMYVTAGGQPAQRAAWLDGAANAFTNGFFANVVRSAENAYVRPNGAGFHDFQNFAAGRLHEAVTRQAAIGPAIGDVSEAWAVLGRHIG